MITKINEFKLYTENMLVPRNLEGREQKLRQQNLKLLQQEEIVGDISFDHTWNFKKNEVSVRKIYGNVVCRHDSMLTELPEWLKDIDVIGSFSCSKNALKTLKNCPRYVSEFFSCKYNNLNSLDGCPKIIGTNFHCGLNHKYFTETDIPEGTVIEGNFYS